MCLRMCDSKIKRTWTINDNTLITSDYDLQAGLRQFLTFYNCCTTSKNAFYTRVQWLQRWSHDLSNYRTFFVKAFSTNISLSCLLVLSLFVHRMIRFLLHSINSVSNHNNVTSLEKRDCAAEWLYWQNEEATPSLDINQVIVSFSLICGLFFCLLSWYHRKTTQNPQLCQPLFNFKSQWLEHPHRLFLSWWSPHRVIDSCRSVHSSTPSTTGKIISWQPHCSTLCQNSGKNSTSHAVTDIDLICILMQDFVCDSSSSSSCWLSKYNWRVRERRRFQEKAIRSKSWESECQLHIDLLDANSISDQE